MFLKTGNLFKKDYILSLKSYIIFTVLFFLLSVVYGYFVGKFYPDEIKRVMEELVKIYGPVFEMNKIRQFLFVFSNNAFAMFFVVFLGIVFGILPILSLFSNGSILGILAFLSKETFSLNLFFKSILPHGVIEVPALLLGAAVGLKLGKAFYNQIFKKEKILKKEFFLAVNFYFTFLLPLLFFAAIIEIFLTAKILNI